MYIKVFNTKSFNTNDSGLISDSIYFYKIQLFNNYGSSEFSEEVNTAGIVIFGNILPPTQLKAPAFGTQLVRLQWIENSDNENYFRIEKKSVYTDFVEIGNVGQNVTLFTDSSGNLYAGSTFYYRVKVFSDSDSAISNVAEVKTHIYNLLAPAEL